MGRIQVKKKFFLIYLKHFNSFYFNKTIFDCANHAKNLEGITHGNLVLIHTIFDFVEQIEMMSRWHLSEMYFTTYLLYAYNTFQRTSPPLFYYFDPSQTFWNQHKLLWNKVIIWIIMIRVYYFVLFPHSVMYSWSSG